MPDIYPGDIVADDRDKMMSMRARKEVAMNFPKAVFKHSSRPSDVLALFKRMILSGRVRPGERLPNERALAGQLGVSRPSLREAVRALAAMNILEVHQGDGTYVTSLDPELLAAPLQLILAIDSSAILMLFELRRILEPGAAALAAERAAEHELGLLRRELDRGARMQGHPIGLVEHDTALHRLVHQAAHNPLLMSVSSSLAGLSRESRLRTVQLPENARLTIQEHGAIVHAICARRSADAAEAMLRHLQRIEQQLRAEQNKSGTRSSDAAHSARRGAKRVTRSRMGPRGHRSS